MLMSALAPSPPSAASKETGEKSAPLNPLHFRELARTQQICNAARQPANLAALEDCGINQSFLDHLLDDVTLCRRKCIDALQHITVMANHCRQATESKRALLAALAEVEAAAEAAWPSDDPANAETRRAFLLQPARPFKVAA